MNGIMRNLKKRTGQAYLELAILIPIFIFAVFGSYDLAIMQVALFDTMTAARDTIRQMGVVSVKKMNTQGCRNANTPQAKILCGGANATSQIAEASNKKSSGPSITLSGFSNKNAQPCQGNSSGKTCWEIVEGGGNGITSAHISIGTDKMNTPMVAQVCSYVQTLIPSLWGQTYTAGRGSDRKSGQVQICTSYYAMRQFQE